MKVIVWGVNSVNELGLVRSLGFAKYDVYLILFDGLVNFVSKSKFVIKSYFIKDFNEALPTVKEISKNLQEKPVLIVAGDCEATYINDNYEEFVKYCYVEGGYKNGDINIYRDKKELAKLAKNIGLNIIETYFVNNNFGISKSLGYPIIVKANNSVVGGKEVMQICNNDEELKEHLLSIDKCNFPLQIQPFIIKDYELMIQGCSLNNGNDVIFPICFHKVRFCGLGKGYAAYGYSIFTDDNETTKTLAHKIALMLKRIGYTGLFSAEFLCKNDRFYFLEINFRNDGTAILSTKSGYNLADYLCKNLVNNSVPKINRDSFRKLHYMNVISDFGNVLSKEIGVIVWIKQLFDNCYWYIFDRHDMLPGVYFILFRIKRKLKNILTRQ